MPRHIVVRSDRIRQAIAVAALLLAIAVTGNAQSKVNPAKGAFKILRIEKFVVDPKVDMSNERLNVLMLEIADELYKIKKFDEILEPKDQLPANLPDKRVLYLTGAVSGYYSVLPEQSDKIISTLYGRVKVTVKFTDESGNVLLEQEIGKHVIYPISFGDVTRKTAKEIARLAKKNFF